MRAAFLIAGCLLLSLVAERTRAQSADGQSVHRCIGEHGEIMFSGIACANPVAQPDARSSTRGTDAHAAVTMACPRSPDALRSALADALARRDTNAISSLVRWDGVGGGEARDRLREIAELGARPLLGIELDSDSVSDAPQPEGTLLVRTGSTAFGGPRERAFRIGASGGCYWLDW